MERESLQEEARDALIHAIGPAHVSYRVRLLNSPRINSSFESSDRCGITAALPSGIRHGQRQPSESRLG
jgi:rhamnogalacturonyl hydrolase YesR